MGEMVEVIDEQYLTDAAQDPQEQVWESDAVIAQMQSVEDPNDAEIPHVRNNRGELSFLNDLEEVVEDFLSDDKPVKPKRPKLDRMPMRQLGADRWRGRTALVGVNPVKVLEESDQRRSGYLYNVGPNIAYISSVSSSASAPNTFPVPVSGATVFAPVPLDTMDDMYAVCAAGQSATLGIIEFFDMD
jgi:hypothetical protein